MFARKDIEHDTLRKYRRNHRGLKDAQHAPNSFMYPRIIPPAEIYDEDGKDDSPSDVYSPFGFGKGDHDMDKGASFIQRAASEEQQQQQQPQDMLFGEQEEIHQQTQSRLGPSVGHTKWVRLHSSEMQGIANGKGDKDEAA